MKSSFLNEKIEAAKDKPPRLNGGLPKSEFKVTDY
jgi:hypothetical protein